MRLNFLDSVAKYYRIGGTRVTHDTVAPSSPANGDLWWEPGARYPQPWEWDSSQSVWICQPYPVSFNQNLLTHTSGTQGYNFMMPVEFYNVTGNRIKLTMINMVVQTFATAQDASNYYYFTLRYLLGTGLYTAAHTMTTNTASAGGMTANNYRRINDYPNVWIPGNAWNIAFINVGVGNPGQLNWCAQVWLRVAR